MSHNNLGFSMPPSGKTSSLERCTMRTGLYSLKMSVQCQCQFMDNLLCNIYKYLCYCNRYKAAIDACCLRDDMETFVSGDETEVVILLSFTK